jgi:hypothetical protein
MKDILNATGKYVSRKIAIVIPYDQLFPVRIDTTKKIKVQGLIYL